MHTINEGSIAGASRKMNLSQPAVSRLISSLEGELRLNLFNRMGRRLSPTPQALAFTHEAGRILANLDEIPRIAAEIRTGQKERLRVVTMPRIASAIVSPAVSQWMSTGPDTRLSLDVRSRREAERWLAGREYDFGIGALPVQHPGIETELLIRARAQAVLPKKHPLAEKSQISVEDLKNEPFIALMQGLLLRTQIDDLFRSAGVVKTYHCEVSASQLACQLVADGAGVSIADVLTIGSIRPGAVELRPITPERWMSFGLLIPRKRKLPPAGLKLIDCIRQRIAVLAANDPNLSL